VLAQHFTLPLAADRKHLAVECADRLVVLVVERVVARQVDEGAFQPVKLWPAVLDEEEREILRQQRPLVGRPLKIDHLLAAADVDGERRHRQSACAERQLQRAADHQVHGRMPVQPLAKQLEHEALVHAQVFSPEVLAIPEQARALAVLDDLGVDIHIGCELPRLGPVAAVLVDAELDGVEVRDPDVDHEIVPLILAREGTGEPAFFFRRGLGGLTPGSR
jgi:hypothetical protein